MTMDSPPSQPPDALSPPEEPQPSRPAVLRLQVEAPETAFLTVELEARDPAGRIWSRRRVRLGAWSLRGWLARVEGALAAWLVWGALALYLLVRLVALPDFPIYFFTDEAVQTVRAADLLDQRFRSPQGELLPTFFENGSQYNLSVSVYLQALPTLLLGKSIWVTRGAAALMTLLAAASVGLILDRVFQRRDPWLGIMLLSVTPAWFLHARTAFETALAASFYAAFLYAYLRYRQGARRALYAAVVFGALAFYTYTPMRVVMLVSALLLFLLDLRYHLRAPRALLAAAGLGLLLALPMLRFLALHPEATAWQMRLLGSYWLVDLPPAEKLARYLGEYLRGLDPLYWYLPNTWDLSRHIMLDYGHLPRWSAPLGLLGVALALRRVRDPRYRTLLVAVLAAPAGAALVRLGITRALVMVIPMAVLAALAAQLLLDGLARRWNVPRAALSLAAFALLAAFNLWMLADALRNGPRWHADYSLTGMQYGAKEVFGAVAQELRADPGAKIIVSPAWANGTDVLARFFFRDPLPIALGSPRGYFQEARPLDRETLLVMTPEEYASIPATRFAAVEVERVLPYPDGRPGFYFVRLEYVADIEQVIAAEERARRQPQQALLQVDGQDVLLTHPRLDIGRPEALFDGDSGSMVRSWAINPLELTLAFAEPRELSGLTLRLGGAASAVEIRAWTEEDAAPLVISRSLPESPVVREVDFEFERPVRAARLSISLANSNDPPDGYVHLWEIGLR